MSLSCYARTYTTCDVKRHNLTYNKNKGTSLITLKEYIFYKYKGTTISITQDETVAFGMPYPLENNWFMAYADCRLSEKAMMDLYTTVYWKSKQMSGRRKGEISNAAITSLKTLSALTELFGSSGMFASVPVNPFAPQKVPPPKRLSQVEKRKTKREKKKAMFAYEKVKPVKKIKVKAVKQPSYQGVSSIIKKCSVDVTSNSFLSTFEWKALRMQALTLHGAKCQCCGATPSSGAVMNVDHVKPRKFYPELALKLDNLQILCGDCNHGKGNWDETDWRIVNN